MGAFTQAQVEADLKANLKIIRDALGDPTAPVPYFRAPNGSWGVDRRGRRGPRHAAARPRQRHLRLGRQRPVRGDADAEAARGFTPGRGRARARRRRQPRERHRGGADRRRPRSSPRAGRSRSPAAAQPPAAAPLTAGFEDGLDGFGPRGDGVQVTRTTTAAHTGTGSLLVTGRTAGLARRDDRRHELAAGRPGRRRLRLGPAGAGAGAGVAEGHGPARQRRRERLRGRRRARARASPPTAGPSSRAPTRSALPPTRRRSTSRAPAGASLPPRRLLARDDPSRRRSSDMPGLKDVLGAPGIEHVGVAVDARETVGRAAQLLQKHYDAITPENAGKPESVQPREGEFAFTHLDQLLDFADAQRHRRLRPRAVLALADPGVVLPATARATADEQPGRPGAAAGAHGGPRQGHRRPPRRPLPATATARSGRGTSSTRSSPTATPPTPHDMRDSRWYQVLGEGFVDEAFRLPTGTSRTQKLFINDYNTEMPEKRADYLVADPALKARGVPIDGVGHQAHVDVARPVQWLEDSIDGGRGARPDAAAGDHRARRQRLDREPRRRRQRRHGRAVHARPSRTRRTPGPRSATTTATCSTMLRAAAPRRSTR